MRKLQRRCLHERLRACAALCARLDVGIHREDGGRHSVQGVVELRRDATA